MIDHERGGGYSVKTGIDIVVVEEFRRSLERGGDIMRGRLFSPAEADGADIQRLAGVFAAKGRFEASASTAGKTTAPSSSKRRTGG